MSTIIHQRESRQISGEKLGGCCKWRFLFLVFSISVFASLSAAQLCACECAPFYCSMEDSASILQFTGTDISGSVTHVPGANGDAASFEPGARIDYHLDMFDAPQGTVSLLFRKNRSQVKGGIWQIGSAGERNSLSLFYDHHVNLYLEIKNADGVIGQATMPNAVRADGFVHVIATWERREYGRYAIKLFVNGLYAGWGDTGAHFVHSDKPLTVGWNAYHGSSGGDIDELRFYDWAFGDPEVYLDYVYASNKHLCRPTERARSVGPVQVVGKDLIVNGKPFVVKGVGYQPVPVGRANDPGTLSEILTNPHIIRRDVVNLKAMNANAIRLWAEPPDDTLLDAMAAEGIYVIMPIEIPATSDLADINYADPCTVAFYEQHARDYVARFKDHPAVLAWAIGNENNLHYKDKKSDWYRLANAVAKVAHETEGETYHPTVIVNWHSAYCGNVNFASDDVSLDHIDIWGHNAYGGRDFHSYFRRYDQVTAKPLVLTEFGVDAYDSQRAGEDEDAQADWVLAQWNQIRANSIGGTVMEYCDEWWKCAGGSVSVHDGCDRWDDAWPDRCANEEYFGVMRVSPGDVIDELMPRKVFGRLTQAFGMQECEGDFNYDGWVDFRDFLVFSGCWLRTDGCGNSPCAEIDLNGDQRVDATDLAVLGLHWRGRVSP